MNKPAEYWMDCTSPHPPFVDSRRVYSAIETDAIFEQQQAVIERWKAFAKYLYVTSNDKIPECYQDLYIEMDE